jgi:hypothetical protein
MYLLPLATIAASGWVMNYRRRRPATAAVAAAAQ